jgi:molybdopterin-containing oxidoreductase family iron-sulfur binding subunit
MGELNLTEIRARLAGARGRTYWKSLEELAERPEFLEFLHKEFPRQAAPLEGEIDRRQFLKLMSASLALAGLTACTRQPTEKVVPYVHVPEEIVPGEPLYFATAMPLSGYAQGLLVESHMGRPTKIEGNPIHPASLGGDERARPGVDLDDVRSGSLAGGPPRRRDRALGAVRPGDRDRDRGAGGPSRRGPSPADRQRHLADPGRADSRAARQAPRRALASVRAVGSDSGLAGSRLAFGVPCDTVLRLERADVILSLDADFLTHGPAMPRYARDFAARRSLRDGTREMSRLYVVETTPSATGAKAYHRLALQARDVEPFARAIAAELGIAMPGARAATAHGAWAKAVAADLRAHPDGASWSRAPASRRWCTRSRTR